MSKQHKWHKEIKAWADGAEIEYDRGDGIWFKVVDPLWHPDQEYRIKPQPKEPKYLYIYWNDVEKYSAYAIEQDFYIFKDESKWKRVGKIKLEVDDESRQVK